MRALVAGVGICCPPCSTYQAGKALQPLTSPIRVVKHAIKPGMCACTDSNFCCCHISYILSPPVQLLPHMLWSRQLLLSKARGKTKGVNPRAYVSCGATAASLGV